MSDEVSTFFSFNFRNVPLLAARLRHIERLWFLLVASKAFVVPKNHNELV